MGIADREFEYRKNQKKRNPFLLGQDNNALIAIIGIILLVFVCNLIIKIIYAYMIKNGTPVSENEFGIFELNNQFSSFIYKPYTLITHFFSHDAFIPLIISIIWLYSFGKLFQDYVSNSHLIPVFIFCGVIGGLGALFLGFTLPYATFYHHGPSAAIMGIAVAITTLYPNLKFFENLGNGVSLWILTLIFICINLAMFVGTSSPSAFIVLFGAAAGFIWGYYYQKGRILTQWMNTSYNWFINIFTPTNLSTKAEREKMFYNTKGITPIVKIPNVSQEKIDKILDKINEQGIQFLTDDEKIILKRAKKDL